MRHILAVSNLFSKTKNSYQEDKQTIISSPIRVTKKQDMTLIMIMVMIMEMIRIVAIIMIMIMVMIRMAMMTIGWSLRGAVRRQNLRLCRMRPIHFEAARPTMN